MFDDQQFFMALGVAGALALLALYFYLKKAHFQQSEQTLSQQLAQLQQESQALTQKYETTLAEKHQAEQWAVQYKTQAENAASQISEKQQEIHRLQGLIVQAEQAENQLEQVINQLNEKSGAALAQAANFAQQLSEKTEQLSEKEQVNQRLQSQLSQAQNELTEIKTTLTEKQANFEAQQRNFVEVKQQLNVEFQHLAQQILDEKAKSFAQTNQHSLDALLKPFKEQIEGFQKRVNEVHSESLKGTANLEAELKRVLQIGLSMSEEAQNLATALKGNNKTAGNWGEVQLESALQAAGLLADEHYVAQQSLLNEDGQRFAPDFVLRLPDQKHLVIDSKVSLLAYDEAVRAEDNASFEQALKAHCQSLRQHIDGLSKKNYNTLIGLKSPDFVLMFVPIEPAYIEAMKFDRGLFNYGYEKNVILVSHTTLMPILRTVANLWRIERGNHEAREIAEKAGDIYHQVCTVAERLSKLGNTLNTVSRQYNESVTALVGKQGLVGKVERFQQLSTKASQMPTLEPLNNEVELTRLELIVEKAENEPAPQKGDASVL